MIKNVIYHCSLLKRVREFESKPLVTETKSSYRDQNININNNDNNNSFFRQKNTQLHTDKYRYKRDT